MFIVQLLEEALNGRTYERTLQLHPKWQLMKTHELLQLPSPDIQDAQQRTTARLQNRNNREGLPNNGVGVVRTQTGRRQSQYWSQRPQPSLLTTCAGCQANAPPASRHIPGCQHFRVSQPGGRDGRVRLYDNNRTSRDAAHRPTTASTSGQGQNTTQSRELITTRPNHQVQVNAITQDDGLVPPSEATEVHINTILTEDFEHTAPEPDQVHEVWESVTERA
ncbi:hypothetical protein SARC_08147 [Sphaeroforma arctica JP610]|uniref:Uncharacterized protein n=1 Tax=Sphaeroforma arctica JP610 TaxID=667725 RepID=A0A0L0FRL0_9EUKA|nr:hypothetical protein SARC_08147 [Sphaeroforma arctica JP610]KNC79462.1 hypothetical protein SARC_08147 [Sphaeroforma arctica JP610]|eukprot:XP_014153364.1 hypothetical protein SARC_08147 [Sphaeroforma arctica JP610]